MYFYLKYFYYFIFFTVNTWIRFSNEAKKINRSGISDISVSAGILVQYESRTRACSSQGDILAVNTGLFTDWGCFVRCPTGKLWSGAAGSWWRYTEGMWGKRMSLMRMKGIFGTEEGDWSVDHLSNIEKLHLHFHTETKSKTIVLKF